MKEKKTVDVFDVAAVLFIVLVAICPSPFVTAL
jgi:hypothetical protein